MTATCYLGLPRYILLSKGEWHSCVLFTYKRYAIYYQSLSIVITPTHWQLPHALVCQLPGGGFTIVHITLMRMIRLRKEGLCALCRHFFKDTKKRSTIKVLYLFLVLMVPISSMLLISYGYWLAMLSE